MSNSYPLIRFSSYKDSLEEQKLESFIKFSRGKGYVKKDVLVEASNEILLYGMLYTDYKTRIESTKQYADLIPGSVISKGKEIVIPSSGETAEDIARASAILSENIILGGDLNVLTLKTKEVSADYLALQLTFGSINKELVKKAQGHSVVHLYNSDLKKINVSLPILEEQIKIGEFFKELDELIELQRLSINSLKELKKGFLQKVFVNKRKKMPQIKLLSNDKRWTCRKLKDYASYTNGKSHEKEQSSSGVYELINLNSISIDGVLKKSGRYVDQTDKVLKKDDIVMILSDIAHGNLLGRVTRIDENDRYALNQRVALLRLDETVDSNFIHHFINRYQHYFKTRGAGMSQLNLSKGDVLDFVGYIPSLKEQKKIGNLLNQLDELVELEQQELEALQEMKKGFLQKMFV